LATRVLEAGADFFLFTAELATPTHFFLSKIKQIICQSHARTDAKFEFKQRF
jgi:hypothetical protein